MLVYLILSIVFTTMFASFYKVATHRNCNLHIVNIWVYIGSTITVLAYVLFTGRLGFNLPALLLGVAAGIMVFFATLSFFEHIKTGQLSASWTVISLSLAFPVLASILIWHEHPTTRQVIGLLLIVIALMLFGRHEMRDGAAS